MFFNAIAKAVVKVVTKDIPKVVTRDIPRIVTKDIPKIVTQDIPKIMKRETYEPALPGLRDQAKRAESSARSSREAFFDLKAELTEKREAYIRLTEDFENRTGQSAADTRVGRIKDRAWNDASNDAERILNDVEGTFRFVLKFVSFDLSEAIWAPAEAKKEKEHLQRRIAAFAAVQSRFDKTNRDLRTAIASLDAATVEIRTQLGDVTVQEAAAQRDQNRMRDGRSAAQQDVARRMLEGGASAEQIILFTGLAADQVAELAKAYGPTSPGATAPAGVEQQALRETVRDLAIDDVETAHISVLTGIDESDVDAMRAMADGSATRTRET